MDTLKPWKRGRPVPVVTTPEVYEALRREAERDGVTVSFAGHRIWLQHYRSRGLLRPAPLAGAGDGSPPADGTERQP